MREEEIDAIAHEFLRFLAASEETREEVARIYRNRSEFVTDREMAALVTRTLHLEPPLEPTDIRAFQLAVRNIHNEMPPPSWTLLQATPGYHTDPGHGGQ